MIRLVTMAVLLLLPFPAFAGDETVKDSSPFVKGIAYYNEGNYAEAIKSLNVAYEKLPSVGDYALLYMAKSYLETGGTDKAINNAKALYEKYPDSPLTEKARGIEAMAAVERDGLEAAGILESYVKDFPSDMDMKFLLANLFKESGRAEEAKTLFKDIYKSVCTLSMDAFGELEPVDITAQDLLERGSGLIQAGQYELAERDLRTSLSKCDDALRPAVAGKLADSLFRQRKYDEAAVLFLEVGDFYNAARSYLRSGNEEEFHRLMQKLVDSKDPKGAKLMIAHAGDLRRKGKSDEAMQLIKKAARKYPEAGEDTLWSMGWLHYVRGDYSKAKKTFSKLYSQYKAPKYLYWLARAGEKTGDNSSELYGKINDDGFYGVLARLRTGRINERAESFRVMEPPRPTPIERIDLLVEAGLSKDAARELVLMSQRRNDSQNLREIALRLMDLQEYRKAMLVSASLPAEMQPFEVQYPLAFWPRIASEASGNGIDPYILLSLIREESRFDPEALSPAGAVGLMQLMPQTAKHTAKKLNVSVNGSESLRDVDLNIKLGTYYLSGLLKKFDSVPVALAAYNAGDSRVKTWLSQKEYGSSDEFIEDIPFEETRNYVKRIVKTYFQYWRARPTDGEVALKIL